MVSPVGFWDDWDANASFTAAVRWLRLRNVRDGRCSELRVCGSGDAVLTRKEWVPENPGAKWDVFVEQAT